MLISSHVQHVLLQCRNELLRLGVHAEHEKRLQNTCISTIEGWEPEWSKPWKAQSYIAQSSYGVWCCLHTHAQPSASIIEQAWARQTHNWGECEGRLSSLRTVWPPTDFHLYIFIGQYPLIELSGPPRHWPQSVGCTCSLTKLYGLYGPMCTLQYVAKKNNFLVLVWFNFHSTRFCYDSIMHVCMYMRVCVIEWVCTWACMCLCTSICVLYMWACVCLFVCVTSGGGGIMWPNSNLQAAI